MDPGDVAEAEDGALHPRNDVAEVRRRGWLLYGPQGLTSRRVMWLSVIFPVWYMIFALIRGAIITAIRIRSPTSTPSAT